MDYSEGNIVKRNNNSLKNVNISINRLRPKAPDNISITSYYYIINVIPAIIITYVYLLFNVLMSVTIILSIRNFSKMLQDDLSKHILMKQDIMIEEINRCHREYVKNSCDSTFLPPAIEDDCFKWKSCMHMDISSFLKSKESASVFAEIINNFFENLSDRSIICLTGILLGSIVVFNLVLHISRTKLLKKEI